MIVALHGFFGTPLDWESFRLPFQTTGARLEPFSLEQLNPRRGLWCSSQHLNRTFAEKNAILMGYSLGGRVALHAALQNPYRWKGLILISTHPGLRNHQDRLQRLHHDLHWCKRFKTDPWDHLLRDWDAQLVFGDHPSPFVRKEKDFSRQALVDCLAGWSLGKQANLREAIAKLDLPVLWITGELDGKFNQLAQEINVGHIHSKKIAIRQAAHRVPWEQPQLFIQVVQEFLSYFL